MPHIVTSAPPNAYHSHATVDLVRTCHREVSAACFIASASQDAAAWRPNSSQNPWQESSQSLLPSNMPSHDCWS